MIILARPDKWLFVCTANITRSPTAEYVARKRGLMATSCGTGSTRFYKGPVVVRLSQTLVEWADVIVCMNRRHVECVKALGGAAKPIYCWDLPDPGFNPYDAELVAECERLLLQTLSEHEGGGVAKIDGKS